MKIFIIKWILPIIIYTIGSVLLQGLPFWTGFTIALLYGFGTSFYWVGVIMEHNEKLIEAVNELEEELEKEGVL